MFYESVTNWQAEDYIVCVRVGFFETAEAAEVFGKQSKRLTRDGSRLVLSDLESGRELDEAYDENIELFKLKESSQGKLTTEQRDYEQVNILISDFGKYPDLQSFGSLSYGVSQAAKLVICGDDGKPLSLASN